MLTASLLQKLRLQYMPALPNVLRDVKNLVVKANVPKNYKPDIRLAPFFPKTLSQPFLEFKLQAANMRTPKRVGVFFSGGQAAGGHNVIGGLYDALTKLHANSLLLGFYEGPKGLIEGRHVTLSADLLTTYRNLGGFDLLGSSRVKIETPEQFLAAETTCRNLKLDGLVVIGGDDSNTNAALLAEYFMQKGCKTIVVGVPKTIDGDLKNSDIEVTFGFDTATKTYAATIGSIMRDTLSSKKYYYFIKLMGRSASHITLECALKTHPNMTLIGEEIEAQGFTLSQLTNQIADLVASRAAAGKDYGVILIPEGIVEFIPEVKVLISELNGLLTKEKPHLARLEAMGTKNEKITYIRSVLSEKAKALFQMLPAEFQVELLLDRDPHGNVQVSQIETERLLIDLVKRELFKRKKAGQYTGSFNAQPLFFGYEGRSCPPSNFDAQYCYALGHVAALLVDAGATGYMSCVKNLKKPVQEWEACGRPLVSMISLEKRKLKEVPIIAKALVDLQGAPYKELKAKQGQWALNDDYSNPGPIQYFGPPALTDSIPLSIM